MPRGWPIRPAGRPAIVLAGLLAGCASHRVTPPGTDAAGARARALAAEQNVPPFASRSYEPLRRQAVIAIALREWRVFGQPVDDDPPGTRPPPPAELKPERYEGLWQRVGEYWWIGLDPEMREAYWTGKHDGSGEVFPASQDGQYAWSAAFISYVMRVAGAGTGFPYSPSHSTYINAAKEAQGQGGWLIVAERPETYAPQPGDLICMGRGRAERLHYDDLPTPGGFPGHCDIVVAAAPGMLSVIGGNVDDAVTMKHVPVTPDGKLAAPDGEVVDTRYSWMVVLRVLYPDSAPPVS